MSRIGYAAHEGNACRPVLDGGKFAGPAVVETHDHAILRLGKCGQCHSFPLGCFGNVGIQPDIQVTMFRVHFSFRKSPQEFVGNFRQTIDLWIPQPLKAFEFLRRHHDVPTSTTKRNGDGFDKRRLLNEAALFLEVFRCEFPHKMLLLTDVPSTAEFRGILRRIHGYHCQYEMRNCPSLHPANSPSSSAACREEKCLGLSPPPTAPSPPPAMPACRRRPGAPASRRPARDRRRSTRSPRWSAEPHRSAAGRSAPASGSRRR